MRQKRKTLGLVVALVAVGMVLAGCSAQSSVQVSGPTKVASKALDVKAFDQLVASGPKASEKDVKANKWASTIKQQGVLHYGGVTDSAVFGMQGKTDGKVRGFDAGLAQLLACYIVGSPKAEVTPVRPGSREAMLGNGAVNAVVATYSIDATRSKRVDFSEPYLTVRQGILVKSDTKGVDAVSDLAGKKVGVRADTTNSETFTKDVPKKAKGVLYRSDDEMFKALKDGKIDAYVTDEPIVLDAVASRPKEFRRAGKSFGDVEEYGIGLPKHTDAKKFVDAWLEKIKADGTWEKLWKLTIGDRTGEANAPKPPVAKDEKKK